VEIFSDPSKPGDDPANFRGRHARAAVGSIALPLGATVEVEMTAEVE
jgi:enamine deaminase RidA (YjgF/YER057c/UK114 family)